MSARVETVEDRSVRSAKGPQIQDVSAWILRAGVFGSVGTMLLGLALDFSRGLPTVQRMQTARFDGKMVEMLGRAMRGDGLAVIETGIIFLVLTPILRVASSMVLFAFEERDGFYAFVTFLVLVLTLLSLFIVR